MRPARRRSGRGRSRHQPLDAGDQNAFGAQRLEIRDGAIDRPRLDEVKRVIPGLNGPTIIDIMNGGQFVAVHAVVSAATIYRTIADLKALGAEGILVTRIERLMS